MNRRIPTRCLVFALVAVGLSGCKMYKPFPLTQEQVLPVRHVYDEVFAEARTYIRANDGLPRQVIAQMIAARDEQMRAILTDDQWARFEAYERDNWSLEIYREFRPAYRDYGGTISVPPSGPGIGGSDPLE